MHTLTDTSPPQAPIIDALHCATADHQRPTQQQLVDEHLPMVKAIANRVRGRVPASVELSDLIQAGVLGLFDAARRFDPAKTISFSTYAKYRVHGAILDSLRRLDPASRGQRRLSKEIESMTRTLSTTLQRAPTEHEVAAELSMSVDKLRMAQMEIRNLCFFSASTRTADDAGSTAPEYAGPSEMQPDRMSGHSELKSLLGGAIKTLPPKYQKVISLYYVDQKSMREIGRILSVNESRVSQIHKSALEKMAAALNQAGVHTAYEV